MMFSLEQLQAAHAKVKTGADFPAYVQEIKTLGLHYYDFHVQDGSITFCSTSGQQIQSASKYAALIISETSSAEQLRHTIRIHQQGQTDFLTFCMQAAAAGVEKWEVHTAKMLCTYYDRAGHSLVEEPIPQGTY